jgi:heme/copper-type cytochrome/quinol oxidase subunit 2
MQQHIHTYAPPPVQQYAPPLSPQQPFSAGYNPGDGKAKAAVSLGIISLILAFAMTALVTGIIAMCLAGTSNRLQAQAGFPPLKGAKAAVTMSIIAIVLDIAMWAIIFAAM